MQAATSPLPALPTSPKIAEIADVGEIAERGGSGREARSLEELSEHAPSIVACDRLRRAACALVAIRRERHKVAVEQHRERDLADRPPSADYASANAMLDTPIANRALRLESKLHGISDRDALLGGERDEGAQRKRAASGMMVHLTPPHTSLLGSIAPWSHR
jgi:hypothetical protein